MSFSTVLPFISASINAPFPSQSGEDLISWQSDCNAPFLTDADPTDCARLSSICFIGYPVSKSVLQTYHFTRGEIFARRNHNNCQNSKSLKPRFLPTSKSGVVVIA